MYFIQKPPGTKKFRSITDLLRDFKCPGPCGPECPLRRVAHLPPNAPGDGGHVYLCDERYAESDPTTIAALLGYIPQYGNDPDAKHIAVIKSSAVRDVQFCTNEDHDPEDDDAWQDLENAEIYLGVFEGPDALEKAARYANTVPWNIRLIPAGD